MLDFLGDLQRTHMCGELRASDAGARAILMGWVNRRRDLGGLIFVDVRDRSGLTQIVFDPQRDPAIHAKASSLRNEDVIAVTGTVARRAGAVNAALPTGEIELIAGELRLLNTSDVPPFTPADAVLPSEETRLQYRYLDLRRPPMQHNLELRHKIVFGIRQFLSSRGFLEVETPFMTRSTPEGARDYLVPSRIYPGSFYALPQSPQLFKQILMIAGTDKYFQVVRCFRDEDLRADRQPEFTQLDLEMSWATQERVFEVIEGMLAAAWEAAGVRGTKTPFPRMSYDEAIRLYGSDKPDLRLPPMTDVRQAFAPENLATLNVAPDLPFVAVRIPKVGDLSRRERDEIKSLLATTSAAKSGVKVLEDSKRLDKSFPEAMARVRELARAEEGDLLVFVAAPTPAVSPNAAALSPNMAVGEADSAAHAPIVASGLSAPAVCTAAGALRLALAQKFADRHKAFTGDIKDPASYHFLWVTDFPMFEWLPDENRWQAAHHPFTSPHERDMENVIAHRDLAAVRSNAYDVVLNGMELGSGSIRIHRQDVQAAIFRALGMSDQEARSRFGFFLEALRYGTPPHGGIALGIDRITMLLAGAESLREVIPFPKTAKAVDLMVDAPTPVSDAQLKELGIALKPPSSSQ
ncbi:MAG TPA: aspartate--tRNA ligase [Terriglobales bacterium]|nr:aspartate--tRNA ligase [Terriglobales bacterium]